ncbi:MAG: phosphoglycerate dehydrogenase-like enzyme [Cryomorphaceae bacterium]|jgi:phosphoglycerate dehydrogenase-like enzyme
MIFNAYADTATATNRATDLIAELGLREAKNAFSDNPAWKPQRVVVNLPAVLSSQLPDFEARLKSVAGSVDLVIDRSDNFILSEEVLKGADAVIGLCSPKTMGNAGAELLWLHNYFVGMDRCKGLSDEQLQNITFTNTKRLSGPAIAEHTIAMLMSLTRGLPAYQRSQRAAKWDPSVVGSVSFGELKGKTILVVGLGGIGTQIAQRAHGLGMRVIATRNSSRSGPDYVEYVGLASELLTLAGKADVIVNSLPLTASTSGLFDKEFFSNAKAGSIFLSVGRGKSTVTDDLIAALESKHVFAAGLDVTDPEPLLEDSPLWAMENVIITPHVSARTTQSLQRTAVLTVENLRRYVAGEALINVVNIRAGY